MNRQEAMQAAADGVGVLEGADIDFGQPTELPCADCGAMVNLASVITVTITNVSGPDSATEMTEADARALLAQVGIPPPLVLCNQHEEITRELP